MSEQKKQEEEELDRDVEKIEAPDCGHSDCISKFEFNKRMIGNLQKGNASFEEQLMAGRVLHDAYILLNALPQELVQQVLRSHGQGVMIVGGGSPQEALSKAMMAMASSSMREPKGRAN